MKKVLTIAMLSACACLLPACNTVSGVGKDVSALGESMDTAAQKTHKAMSEN